MSRSFEFVRGSLALLTFVLLTALCWAQKDTGTIVGTVKDSSGAVVADANVTVTDVDRGTSFKTAVSAQGR